MKIVSQHRKEMHDIQDIMFAMEEEWSELENEAKQDFQSLRDEIKNKVTVSSKLVVGLGTGSASTSDLSRRKLTYPLLNIFLPPVTQQMIWW